MFFAEKKFLGYVKTAFLMIFKIRPDENPFLAPLIFNHSSANFDPTVLCQTILESLGWGEKGGVFEFAKNCPNKK